MKVGRLVESHLLFVPYLCHADLSKAGSFCSKTVLKVSVPSETRVSIETSKMYSMAVGGR